jgi:peptidoglycan/xylan/chitin deacetylase (PgdA/CDA1 family)
MDFYTEAFPILEKYNFCSTVFIPTNFIGKAFNGKECLNWTRIKELKNNGVSFGSHTMKHLQLNTLFDLEIEHEIKHSKEIIEDKLGAVINTFSYPFKFPDENGRFKELLRNLLQRHSYTCGVSSRIGKTAETDDIYFMKRIPVNSHDDSSFFRAKLEGGYDWLYRAQSIFKLVKTIHL